MISSHSADWTKCFPHQTRPGLKGARFDFSRHFYHHKPCQSPSSLWWCEDGHIDASLDDYWQGGCGAQCPLQFPLFSLSLNFFKFFNFLIPSTSPLFAYHLIIILLMPLLSLPIVCKRLKCQMRCNYQENWIGNITKHHNLSLLCCNSQRVFRVWLYVKCLIPCENNSDATLKCSLLDDDIIIKEMIKEDDRYHSDGLFIWAPKFIIAIIIAKRFIRKKINFVIIINRKIIAYQQNPINKIPSMVGFWH